MISVVLVAMLLTQGYPFTDGLEGQISDEVRLTKRLLKGYVRTARPVRRDRTPINLTLDIAYNQLLDIDEQRQVMAAALWLRVGWVDEYLQWNATKEGVKAIILSPRHVWMPDITLINNAHEDRNTIPVDKQLIVNSSGYVTWLQAALIKSQCTINSLYFPFDIQTCPLIFGSWSYNAAQVDLFSKNHAGDISEFVPNGVWHLQELPMRRESRLYQCCPESFTTITYYVVLQRLSLYFIFHLYLPCILISFLTLLVFYLPCDTGEKTSFAVTMMLALTVFMLVASEYLPPSSSHIPIISQYFTGTIVLMGSCLGATVCTLHIHHKGDSGAPAPTWLRRLTLHYLAKPLCLSSYSTRLPESHKYKMAPTEASLGSPFRAPTSRCPLASSGDFISDDTPCERLRSQHMPTEGLDNCIPSQLKAGNNNNRQGECVSTDSLFLPKQYRSEATAGAQAEWSKIAAVLDRSFLVLFFLLAVILNAYTFARYFCEKQESNFVQAAGNVSNLDN